MLLLLLSVRELCRPLAAASRQCFCCSLCSQLWFSLRAGLLTLLPVGSYTCPGVAAWGCDTDVHTLSPLVPVGSTIGLFCPASCNLCGAEVDTTSCEPANAPARVDAVMAACCPRSGKGGHRLMQSCDLPEVCPSDECAAAFISFMDDCSAWLMANSESLPISDFHTFYVGCEQLVIHDMHDPVTCSHTPGGAWQWQNLPCVPVMEASDRGFDSTPEGDERCLCHSILDDSTKAYDGPSSAAECAHVLCHSYQGEFWFDSCSWDGVEVATAQPASDNSLTTITSDPSALCVTCQSMGSGDDVSWQWTNLPCEPGIDREGVLRQEGNEADFT